MTGKNHKKPQNNKTIRDKSDHGVLFDIKKHLRKKHGIRASRILINHTIKFTKYGCKMLGQLHHLEISNIAKNNLVHTPDIMVIDDNGDLILIIELDGKSHESEEVTKKDKKRNSHYAKEGIKFIIINTTKLKKKKKQWTEYLDEEMDDLDV